MFRIILPFVLLFAVACGDSFYSVQQADTIEAYERYLATANPNRAQLDMATMRLEKLYLEQAKEAASLEAYDAFLERYPEGKLRDEALANRETFLYARAVEVDDPANWQRYLDEYPKGPPDHKKQAHKALVIAGYRDQIAIGDLTIADVNLAENPKGPMDGVGFTAKVTNNGPKTLKYLALTLTYQDAEGVPVSTKEWAVVNPTWRIPMPEEATRPMKPGDTRTWSWSEAKDRLPKSYGGKGSLRATSIAFDGE